MLPAPPWEPTRVAGIWPHAAHLRLHEVKVVELRSLLFPGDVWAIPSKQFRDGLYRPRALCGQVGSSTSKNVTGESLPRGFLLCEASREPSSASYAVSHFLRKLSAHQHFEVRWVVQ